VRERDRRSLHQRDPISLVIPQSTESKEGRVFNLLHRKRGGGAPLKKKRARCELTREKGWAGPDVTIAKARMGKKEILCAEGRGKGRADGPKKKGGKEKPRDPGWGGTDHVFPLERKMDPERKVRYGVL